MMMADIQEPATISYITWRTDNTDALSLKLKIFNDNEINTSLNCDSQTLFAACNPQIVDQLTFACNRQGILFLLNSNPKTYGFYFLWPITVEKRCVIVLDNDTGSGASGAFWSQIQYELGDVENVRLRGYGVNLSDGGQSILAAQDQTLLNLSTSGTVLSKSYYGKGTSASNKLTWEERNTQFSSQGNLLVGCTGYEDEAAAGNFAVLQNTPYTCSVPTNAGGEANLFVDYVGLYQGGIPYTNGIQGIFKTEAKVLTNSLSAYNILVQEKNPVLGPTVPQLDPLQIPNAVALWDFGYKFNLRGDVAGSRAVMRTDNPVGNALDISNSGNPMLTSLNDFDSNKPVWDSAGPDIYGFVRPQTGGDGFMLMYNNGVNSNILINGVDSGLDDFTVYIVGRLANPAGGAGALLATQFFTIGGSIESFSLDLVADSGHIKPNIRIQFDDHVLNAPLSSPGSWSVWTFQREGGAFKFYENGVILNKGTVPTDKAHFGGIFNWHGIQQGNSNIICEAVCNVAHNERQVATVAAYLRANRIT